MLTLFTTAVSAQTEFTVDDFTYRVLDDETTVALVSAPAEISGDVVIPEMVSYDAKEYTVTEIGASAFSGRSAVTTVSLPNTVTTLGEYAFYDCTGLTSIALPNSVKTIGAYAFRYAGNDESVEEFFVSLGNGVTSIGERAFDNCDKIKSITIPASVTFIEASAFWNMDADIAVTIEDSETPLTLNCASSYYPIFEVNHTVTAYVGRNIERTGSYANRPTFDSNIVSVSFGPNVTVIGDYEYNNRGNLVSVTGLTNVVSIGEHAFGDCPKLTTVEIGDKLETLGGSTFDESGLTSLSLPGTLKVIPGIHDDMGICERCYNLASVTLGEGIEEIGSSAFYNALALEEITIPSSVKRIGRAPFFCNRGNGSSMKRMILADSDTPMEFANGTSEHSYGYGHLTDNKSIDYFYLGRDVTREVTNDPLVYGSTDIEIGPKVTEIGTLFDTTRDVKNVKVHHVSPIAIADNAFTSDTYSNATLWVPGGTVADYQAADGWKQFTNIQTWSYVINFAAKGHGAIAIDDEVAKGGEAMVTRKPNGDVLNNSRFTVTITPDKGYELTSLTQEDLTEPTPAEEIFAGNTDFTNPFTVETAINHDLTYEATFAPITYNLTYKLAGGALPKGKTNPATYTIESEDFTLVNPTRAGYTFMGWTGTGLEKATKTVTIAQGSTGNRSYTATWKVITYNLTYDLADGELPEGNTNPATYTIESETFTLVNPVKKGYTFEGWTGTGLTAPTKDVTIAKGSKSNRSYTATWKPITYTISYELDGGELAEGESNPMEYTIESGAITLKNPTKENFDFAGWIGTGLEEPTMEVTIAAGSTENRSYTATWTAIVGIRATMADTGNDVYDLNGRKVTNEYNAKRLTKGVYIVNGKKHVVNK